MLKIHIFIAAYAFVLDTNINKLENESSLIGQFKECASERSPVNQAVWAGQEHVFHLYFLLKFEFGFLMLCSLYFWPSLHDDKTIFLCLIQTN